MASTLNAGVDGIVLTASSTAALNIQAGGTNAIQISTGAATTITNATITTLTTSNPLVFPAGSASAPAVTTTGDTNTGIYFPAADQVAVTTGGTVAAAFNSNGLFFRNRIINGDMRIDQRNAGASITPTNLQYSVDRWKCYLTQASKYTVQQNAGSVAPPAGFSNYLGAVSSSAYSVAATDTFLLSQLIEGYNISDFNFGAANALTITLSFWVRSSLTGTFGGNFSNSDFSRNYPFTFTISAANTWEKKTVTITGDTSGTWQTANSVGLIVSFNLGTGSTYSGPAGSWSNTLYYTATGATSVVGTNGATFYITGVQLETGSVATPFERRPYGTELMLCQRYYYRLKSTGANYPFGFAQCYSTTSAGALIPYPVTMRTAPSALEQSGTATDYQLYQAGGGVQACSAVPAYAGVLTTTAYGAVNFTVAANIVAGNITQATGANSSAYLGWSAEL